MNDPDKILHFLINHFNTKRHVWMPNVKYIQEELFPFYNVDQIISLLNQIQHNQPDILKFKRTDAGDLIQITGLTESFLNQGGFTETEKKTIELKKRELNKSKVDFEKSIIDLRLKKWQVKTFWPIFVFAIIGSGLGVYNFINSLTPSKNTEKLEERIEEMESELEKLQTSISALKNRDSLYLTKDLTENGNK